MELGARDVVDADHRGHRSTVVGTGHQRTVVGHLQVDYADISEAAEAVQTASLLMRLLDRVEARLSASPA